MITITKEKNILKIEVSGTIGHYALDMNTGIFYGKKGTPIKTYPMAKYDLSRAFRNTETTVGSVIGYIIGNGNSYTSTLRGAENVKAILGADKIDSLALGVVFDYSPTDCRFINDNFTAFVKYVKSIVDNNEEFTRVKQHRFREWLAWEKGQVALGQYVEHITEEMYRIVTNRGGRTFSIEEWGTIAYYLTRGRVWEYHNHDCTKIVEYIGWCRAMNKTPNRQNNFMREYCETKKEYELRKTEFDNNALRNNYKAKEKAFTFSYGNYVVVVPTCTKDIIDEGVNMHHCVGGYVNRVIEGRDYIVFVRHKDNPEKCYITCEVYTDGRIGQYFLAYDNYISSVEDREFYQAFSEHLANNW